jgi:hypothetical protein
MFLDIYRFDEDRNKSRKSKEEATIKLEKLQNLMLNKINKWEQYPDLSRIFKGSDIEDYKNSLNSIYQTYPEANREILDIWFQNVTHSLKCDELSGLVYRMPINEFVESMP